MVEEPRWPALDSIATPARMIIGQESTANTTSDMMLKSPFEPIYFI
jgi:hypothetical protein